MSIISRINKQYTSSPRTNPTILYELLFGSQQVVDKTITVDALNKKLVEDFRAQIVANLPVFYLLDAEEIVNGVLEDALSPALNSNKKRGLSKYLEEIRSGSMDFVEYYGDAFLSFEKDYYTEVTSKGTLSKQGFESAYTQAYNYLVSKKAQIIKDVQAAINANLKNKISITEVARDLNDVVVYINGTVADLVSTGLSQTAVQKATKVVSASAAGRIMREAFKKYPKTQIGDAEKIISGFNKSTMVLAVAANYELAVTSNHNAATAVILKYLENIPVVIETEFNKIRTSIEIVPTDQLKVGNLVAAGHAAVKSSNKGIIGINTPALQLALAILQASDKPIPGLVKAFIGETGHAPYAIEITTDYENFAGSLINLQASLLRSQRSAINSGVISPQETAFIEKVFKEALGKSFLEVRKDFISKVRSGKVGRFLTDNFAQSPTLKQSVKNKFIAVLSGDTAYRSVPKKTTSKNTKIDLKGAALQTIKSPKVSKISPKGSGKVAKPVSVTKVVNATPNLANLISIINSALSSQIKQNMGDGDRKDILNLRTGRFADSVKVERISQSRQGLITAFYNYMKNPYATFSMGGRQELPKSRDPKLLIAKSIRELAQNQAIARLRAVSL